MSSNAHYRQYYSFFITKNVAVYQNLKLVQSFKKSLKYDKHCENNFNKLEETHLAAYEKCLSQLHTTLIFGKILKKWTCTSLR